MYATMSLSCLSIFQYTRFPGCKYYYILFLFTAFTWFKEEAHVSHQDDPIFNMLYHTLNGKWIWCTLRKYYYIRGWPCRIFYILYMIHVMNEMKRPHIIQINCITLVYTKQYILWHNAEDSGQTFLTWFLSYICLQISDLSGLYMYSFSFRMVWF